MTQPDLVSRREPTHPDRDAVDPSSTAFFFDFDGTLAEFVPIPDQVLIDPRVVANLRTLHHASNGALAIVSGRPIEQLDRYLGDFRPALAGVHGLQYRNPDGTLATAPFDASTVTHLSDALTRFSEQHTGLIAETKPGSVALHYRMRPDLEEEARSLGSRLASQFPGIEIMHGKMVVELRLGGRSKGDAVSHFMAMPPFAGRTPLFVGDDVTDEDGIARAQSLGGLGCKVGPGNTAARRRFDAIADFWTWLDALARNAERDASPDRMQRDRSTLS